MEQKISIKEASNTFFNLINMVLKGKEIIITQNDEPIAKLMSIVKFKNYTNKRIKAGSAKGQIKIADDFDEPLEDFKEYM